MVRKAREYLNTPQYNAQGQQLCPKLILFADYYEVIDYLMRELSEFNPVEYTGRVSEDKGNLNKGLFQELSARCRLLIGNPLVGGIMVNLHDTAGYFPRMMYIMPNYKAMDSHQAAHRVYRDGTVGPAGVRFFYGLSGAKENSILSAVSRKGEVMQKVHSEQGSKFPNEYDTEYERQPPGLEWEEPVVSYPVEEDSVINSMIEQALSRMQGVSLGR